MKLIRAILRHSLLLAIVVGAGVAYYYRDDLLPKFYEKVADLRSVSEGLLPGKKAADEIPDSETVAGSVATDEPAVAKSVAAPPDVAAKDGSGKAEEVAVAPSAESVPPVAQVPVAEPSPSPDLSRYRPLEEDGVDSETAPDTVPDTDSASSAPASGSFADSPAASEATTDSQAQALSTSADTVTKPEQLQPSTAGSAPPPPEDTVSSSPEARNQLRAGARSAFWRHDYQQAESDYKALAELDPADPDAYGELGNVYFSQGKWDLAADAFYEAGVRLIRMGEGQRARDLLVIVRGLSPERAVQLEQQLTQSQGGAGN